MESKFMNSIDLLDELLDQEREDLLQGKLDAINRVSARKEALVEELKGYSVADDVLLLELSSKLERNQVLLGSALEGVKSVVKRFADMRQVKESLATYDAFGQRNKIEILSKRVVEKRA
jgi:flagellar biosynthesis/type III secretory pathway chaperone